MSMLTDLGIDHTIWIQLGCFLVSLFFISQLVFKPYMKVYTNRMNRSGENLDTDKMFLATEELKQKLNTLQKEIHAKTKTLYEEARLEAGKVGSALLQDTRIQANVAIEKARAKLSAQIEMAQAELVKEIPAVSAAVVQKLIGRELGV